MLISPSRAIYHYPTREDNLLVCNSYIDASYMIAFFYPILLIVVCTVYAVLTRKIPEAFNESKHIGKYCILRPTTQRPLNAHCNVIKFVMRFRFCNLHMCRLHNVHHVCDLAGICATLFWHREPCPTEDNIYVSNYQFIGERYGGVFVFTKGKSINKMWTLSGHLYLQNVL